MPNVFGGTATFALNNSGTVSNTNVSGMGGVDAIFFNGDPGSTSEGSDSSSARGCIEAIAGVAAPQINCQFDIDIDNTGTISSADGVAIRGEDEAVISGTIDNAAAGVISGGSAGILINGAQAEHDLTITNAGTITGTAGDGLVITGDGVNLVNQTGGIISGSDAGLMVAGTTASVRSSDRNDENTLTTVDNGLSLIHI